VTIQPQLLACPEVLVEIINGVLRLALRRDATLSNLSANRYYRIFLLFRLIIQPTVQLSFNTDVVMRSECPCNLRVVSLGPAGL
jgi:hypothetical protein